MSMIPIKDLRMVTNLLFDHLEQTGLSEYPLKQDYYWNIPIEHLYNTESTPADHDIGQLSDDWDELAKLLDRKADPLAYHLVWLSGILRAIGEERIS